MNIAKGDETTPPPKLDLSSGGVLGLFLFSPPHKHQPLKGVVKMRLGKAKED